MTERAQAARRRLIEASYASPLTEGDGEIYRSSDAVEPPSLAERTEPAYTEDARIARQEGAVVLQADISADGRAGNFRLLRSLGLGLDEKAVEAVRQWEFEPARKGKQKVPFRAVLEIQFRVL
jgi:TonB family protein